MKVLKITLIVISVLSIGNLVFISTSFYEGQVVKTTNWGYEWDGLFVARVLRSAETPYTMISHEIRRGQDTRYGGSIIFVDTLVITVSGPRQEVLETLVYLENLIH